MCSVSSSLPPDNPSLPTDLQTAHAEILSLRRAHLDEMELLRAQLVGRDRQIRVLQAKLDELARRVFGKKSEKLDPRQLRLALDLLASAVELSPEGEPIESDSGESLPPSPRKKSKSRGRRPLPKHLPRRQVVVDLPESEKRCARGDRKSTRLNSSHVEISYAVFCLKKKK